MKKIAILGLGLIGGSLAKILKNSGYYVIGVPHRQETLEAAKSSGSIDEGSLGLEAVSAADIVFICTPISLIIPKLKEMLRFLKPGAIVTDVGSTKSEIVANAEKLMPKDIYFVGGHPMAGKEKVKFESADSGLFKGKKWIIAKTPKTNKQAIKNLVEVLTQTGANIIEMGPKSHDFVVAGISHAPLAVSASLVNMVAKSKNSKDMATCASSGFIDTTRIASGDPGLGIDMFITNKKAVLQMIKAFKGEIGSIEKAIRKGSKKEIKKFLLKAKSFRDKAIKQD